jgi:hypothetical protein
MNVLSVFTIKELVTIATTIVTGLTIAYFQRIRLRLNYYVTETESYDSNYGYLKFYTVKIYNPGSKMVEAVNFKTSFSDGKIDKITDNDLIKDLKISDNNLSFNVDYIVSKENLSFTITIKEAKKGASKSEIKIRAKDAKITEKTNSKNKLDGGSFFVGIVVGMVVFLAVDYFTTPDPEVIPPKADKIENVFSILNHSQLSYIFPQIINSNDDMSYVGTAFYLTHSYLIDTLNHERYVRALKLLSQIDDISLNSKGAIYYLIFKIRKRENNNIESDIYLQKCKQETPFMYNQLMEQDQYYDLDSLRNAIIKNNNLFKE